MGEGWIKLHRKIVEWEWYHDDFMYKFFTRLVMDANYEDSRFEGHEIKRGQVVTGRVALAKRFNASERKIRTALQRLKSTSEVTIETTNKFSIITIVNYEQYAKNDQQVTSTSTNERPANDQQVTTSKKEKKEKNNNMLNFESIYKKYPRKIGKKKGILRCKAKIKTDKDFQSLDMSVDNYAAHTKSFEERFIKHFSTFMNEWEDWIHIEQQDTSFRKQLIYDVIVGNQSKDTLNDAEKEWISDNGGLIELGQRKSEYQVKNLLGLS